MEDLINQLRNLEVSTEEQQNAVATVINIIKNNEVNPRQISIGEYKQISLFDWKDKYDSSKYKYIWDIW